MDDGSFNMRNWYFNPSRGTLALQLMSNVTTENDTKPLIPSGSFYHRDSCVPEPPVHMEYNHPVYGGVLHSRESKLMHVYSSPSYGVLPGSASGTQTIQMLQPPEPPRDEKVLTMDEPEGRSDAPLKKRSQGRPPKSPKQKKPKKVYNPERVDTSNGSVSKRKAGKKSADLVINGIDLDLSGIPTPVCSCTGNLQQCYRWGVGGWQSACCTISISQYPLPMSSKRKGARIAGRKMSLGAFKKVLERLAGEGQNLSHPIDLKSFWAKHGTNKFVTIR
ncbi:protein Barley B recombinant-like [Iris pallida]|uniref:GAGA-binding transcriptional activator n=1 Tax=Iris pallida TaxID=29817 RepID=A0AAX6HWU4_IRIPA|nr:protein Barley B recombinant-like [Iris pallida]KAJ6845006.1 protein Barley B recombinant-like [Iris pallida]KAJ6845007.1 protein Barley B recombinant-like [Iris pallida]